MGLGETDPWKNQKQKSCDTVPLILFFQGGEKAVTYDKVLDGAATIRPSVQVKAQTTAVHCNNITV